MPRLIAAEKLFQLIPRLRLPGIGSSRATEDSFCKIEVFAIVGLLLFHDGFRPALPTLMRNLSVILNAIQAHSKVRAALVTPLTSPRLPVQGPLPTTMIAMTRHGQNVAPSKNHGNHPIAVPTNRTVRRR